MKKFLLALIAPLLFWSFACVAASADGFPGTTVLSLKTLMSANTDANIAPQIAYVPTRSTVLQKTLKNHPVSKELEEAGITTTRLLRTKIDGSKNASFYIDFHPGSSDDPTFLISPETDKGALGEIEADQLIIPGDGFVYAVARTNRNHVEHRKFVVRGTRLVEMKQSFLYAGLNSTARSAFKIMSEKAKGETIASIAKGESMTVVLSDGNDILIKTNSGLLGWLKLDTKSTSRDGRVIEDYYFSGD